MRRTFLLGSLLLPSLLSAQHHTAVFAPALRPSPAPVAAIPLHPGAIVRTVPAPTATAHRMPSRPYPRPSRRPGPRIVPSPSLFDASRNDGSNSFDGFDDPQAPGLGFDYVHFAATHPQGAHRRNLENRFITPLFGGAFYPFYSVADEAAAEPPVEQTDESSYDRPPLMRRQPSTQLTEAPNSQIERQPAYAPAESDEYIFVRRDGTVFFAVAYTWDLKTLRYVTSQGLRQSISSDSLDLDATHQFNEQRGLPFRSPT